MILRIIFTWWNKQTFGTFLKTLFFGKFVGSDEHGNKYYQSKKNERWVVYAKNIFLAGDWVDTGLPATIEGSILSGFEAARVIAAVNS